jgi:hypothetical protein
MGKKILKSGLLVSSAMVMTMALGGCASLMEDLARTQNTSALNPSTVQAARTSVTTARAGKRLNDMNAPADRMRGRAEDPCNPDEQSFLCIQKNSSDKYQDEKIATRYLYSGIALSNELCNNWFDSLYVTNVTLTQSSDLISSTGSLTSAILGFSRAKSKDIGLIASVFGFAKESNDSLMANYVVATDLTTLAAAINEYRAGYAQQLEKTDEPWNYYTARRAIMAYDNSCSALAVKRFVNFRVSGNKPTETAQPMFEQALKQFIKEWAGNFETAPTAEIMPDIYAYLYLKDAASPAVVERLETSLKVTYLDLSKLIKAPESADSLRMALTRSSLDAYLERLGRLRLSNIDSALKAEEAKKAEDKKKINTNTKAQQPNSPTNKTKEDSSTIDTIKGITTEERLFIQPKSIVPNLATDMKDETPVQDREERQKTTQSLRSMPSSASGRPLDQAPLP